MRPYKVTFYVYADSEDEVQGLQKTMNNFVREKYNNGVLVTAKRLGLAMEKFGNNFLVTNFLKNDGK